MDNVFAPIGFVAAVVAATGAVMFVIYLVLRLLDSANNIEAVDRRVGVLQDAVERLERAGKRAASTKRR